MEDSMGPHLPKPKGEGKKVRLAYTRQNGKCYYCHAPMGDDVTAEHLVSKSQGGKLSDANTRAAHAGCNTLADSLPLEVKIQAAEAGRMGGMPAFQSVISKAKNQRRIQRSKVEKERCARKAARRAWAAVNAAKCRDHGPEKKS